MSLFDDEGCRRYPLHSPTHTTRPACHLSAITPTVAIVATGPCRFFPSTLHYYYLIFFFSPFLLFGVSLHGMTSSIQDIVLAHRLSAIRASPFSLLHTYSQRGISPLTLIDLLVLDSSLLYFPPPLSIGRACVCTQLPTVILMVRHVFLPALLPLSVRLSDRSSIPTNSRKVIAVS